MLSFILLSGGKGSRMKNSMPKQYLQLAGKPIILHTLERVDKMQTINEIIIVCENTYQNYLSNLIKEYNLKNKYVFVSSGKTRQESVFNGLNTAINNSIIIHEAARPFVLLEEFNELALCDYSNAIFGYQIPFTVLKGNEYVNGLLSREELINVQLPQKFERLPLLNAHLKAIADNKNFTEDASLLYYYDKSFIKILQGNSYNVKITEPIDLITSEIIYKEIISRRK